MKVAKIVVRTLMGLLFLFASVTFFLMYFGVFPPPPMEGPIKTFNDGLMASGYFFFLLKITEFSCGVLLVIGRFVPLALVILSPIIVNILMVGIFLDRSSLPIPIFLVLANSFLAYCYRDAFAGLLKAR
ncbi:MAG: DoxX family protein [Acidobacteria bacterium]|nr:DoxX family protein [Acidobacteriota bacterium]